MLVYNKQRLLPFTALTDCCRCVIIFDNNEVLTVKHSTLIFVTHCYMFKFNEPSSGITLPKLKNKKIKKNENINTLAVCVIS